MALKPWYNVVYPRDDLQKGQPLDASQFAVHLDKVKERKGDATYYNPQEFFDRTFLTKNLLEMAAEMVRRLAGETVGTSPAFNMATQFGGGKTHALTLLYHLAENGPAAQGWTGVQQIMQAARISSLPRAKTAIFVGMNFDPRGGDDGTPHRRTPWGDIAWQLGGAEGYAIFEKFDQEGNAPAGETIGKLLDLVNQPVLILVDELVNYMSRYRGQGLAAQLYNFLFNLSNEVSSRTNVVLAVSVPKSVGEMNAEDIDDYNRLTHMLGRLSKSVIMSVESDAAEIIRRRLFDWGEGTYDSLGRIILNNDAVRTCNAYADWIQEHRSMLPGDFPFDRAREEFRSTYPFHPVVLSVFERKWQSLPDFQRTRGVLRMLALWISHAYNEGVTQHKGKGDALLTLGMAPLDDPYFRQDVFSQLGNNDLQTAVTTDIIGRNNAHALRLDQEAAEMIRGVRLHRKVATAIFFESNGGQSSRRMYASVPEIRLAVGQPDLDIGNVETVLEALAPPSGTCFYLDTESRGYWFSSKANLTQVLSHKKADIKQGPLEDAILATIQEEFGQQSRDGLSRKFFPTQSSDIPNQPVLTLVVLPPSRSMRNREQTLRFVEEITKNYASSARVYKSGLIWSVADSDSRIRETANTYLAWEMIQDEQATLQLSDSQVLQLGTNLKQAKGQLKEAVWQAYSTVMLLGPGNTMIERNLGRQHSSSTTDIANLILRELRATDDVLDTVSPNFLVRKWPPAFQEWSTQAVRDVFYASPQFPRIRNSDAVKEAIAKGVSNGILGYVGKANNEGVYHPFYFDQPYYAVDVELTPDMFIITREVAEAAQARATVGDVPGGGEVIKDPSITGDDGLFGDGETFGGGGGDVAPDPEPGLDKNDDEIPDPDPTIQTTQVTWRGQIPTQKWGNFYLKALARFANDHELSLTVDVVIRRGGGISDQRIDELKAALRELGLGDDVEVGE